jgi:hypothetical protein
MSTVRTNNVQVGQSVTATNNFTLYQPTVPDGTVRLGVGNTGATTLDAVTVTNAGNVTAAGSVSGTTGSFSGNLSFNSGYGAAAVAYGCRAWVNFNGTGTVAIRASGNVSSITDNGTGNYTINFTTAMPNANYATPIGAYRTTSWAEQTQVLDHAVGSFRILHSADTAGNPADTVYIAAAVFR